MFSEYIFVFKYLLFCLLVSLILFLLSVILVYQKPELEKLSAYECGFNPFSDARSKFEVKFYLVGILFIIFDLELIYLYPWIITINDVFLLVILQCLFFYLF